MVAKKVVEYAEDAALVKVDAAALADSVGVAALVAAAEAGGAGAADCERSLSAT